ncbi:DUF4265 domain-containing protein [Nocardia sp. NPDC047038]|uniref:DUF4265 domain-containing protein n=1 Tax=Nocardia sp. NPDC047038 TaxID=3154338 RepID=UPI0033F85AA3
MSDDRSAGGHAHVRVLAGTKTSGEPVYEVLPAKLSDHSNCEILGSPGIAYGFAAGDHLRMADDGSFEVLRRGGNLCVRIYPADARPADAEVSALTTRVDRLRGLVEMPSDRRFVVITVPVAVGFPAVEQAVGEWAAEHGCEWEYGNVYDEHDAPRGWWMNGGAAR